MHESHGGAMGRASRSALLWMFPVLSLGCKNLSTHVTPLDECPVINTCILVIASGIMHIIHSLFWGLGFFFFLCLNYARLTFCFCRIFLENTNFASTFGAGRTKTHNKQAILPPETKTVYEVYLSRVYCVWD